MSEDIILHNLNAPQKEAVMHTQGPLLVFAGAGSGKTRVITSRIAYLIARHDVRPENILAVTFTKKASEEMLERINSLLEKLNIPSDHRPTIGTFHSLGALILRKEAMKVGLTQNFSIYDSDDSENLVKEIMMSMNLDIKQTKPQVIYWYISAAKNDLVSPEDFSFNYSGFIEDIAGEVYDKYQKQLKAQNAVDFGDLLYLVSKLFLEDKQVLEKYQEQFKYILIDEYQDTNKAQYVFAKSLAEKERNLCVVGDDDQGIYGWRGADIKNILSFEKDFPDVKVIKLEQNYRSVGNVIAAAVAVIQRNGTRADKKLWTDKEEGEKIIVYQARDPEDETNYVIDELMTFKRKGRELSDVAILYRTNYQSRAIEEGLLRRGIPYKLVGGFRFYERKEIKDLISYLRFIHNIKDDLSLSRVLNIPSRKLGPKSIADIYALAKSLDISVGELLVGNYLNNHSNEMSLNYSEGLNNLSNDNSEEYKNVDDSNDNDNTTILNQAILEKVKTKQEEMRKFESVSEVFGSLFVRSKKLNAVEAINLIIDKVNYTKWIDDETDEAQSKLENIEELKNVANSYVMKSPDKSISIFLQELTLIEQEQNKNKEHGANAVTLMTMHSAKGLEFPAVFIVGMEEGVFPHSRSFTNEKELEEERRLCYVGITRAKERLWLTFSEARVMMGGYSSQIPSRFLAEIPQELCDYYSWNS